MTINIPKFRCDHKVWAWLSADTYAKVCQMANDEECLTDVMVRKLIEKGVDEYGRE